MAIKITPVETDGPVSVPVTRKTKQTPPETVSVASDAPVKRPRGFAAMSRRNVRLLVNAAVLHCGSIIHFYKTPHWRCPLVVLAVKQASARRRCNDGHR